MKKYFLIAAISLIASQSFAWGGRGHSAICEAAVNLVTEPGLKAFVQTRPHTMGHLCNIPDIYWKGLGGAVGKIGNPTHFIDAEILGLPLKDIPTDYSKIMAEHTGQENKVKPDLKIFSIPTEFGSLWWRADQFARRIAAQKEEFAKAAIPANGKEEQDDSLPYNKAAYEMMINMGLMGHFVGDASQPIHNSVDYDGYMSGHGGIHSYYEEQVVVYFDADLQARIARTARAMKSKASFLKPSSTVEKMKALSILSFADIKEIYKLDPVLKPSTLSKEKGMEIKKAAERKPAAEGYKVFNKLIVKDMARSALLLAKIWDESYVAAGKPNLDVYRSFKYPFTPEFIPPDYFAEEVKKEETKKE